MSTQQLHRLIASERQAGRDCRVKRVLTHNRDQSPFFHAPPVFRILPRT